MQVIHEQAAHTRKPPLTPRDLATLLSKAGVPGFADDILPLMPTPLDRAENALIPGLLQAPSYIEHITRAAGITGPAIRRDQLTQPNI